MEAKFFRLESIKDDKALEIVYLLDLFEGKLSLNEILNLEIPLLSHLKRAKKRLMHDMKK